MKTIKTLQLAYFQIEGFAKKNMDKMSADTYKQNVTTVMILATLQSFGRKSHFPGLARLKKLLLHSKYIFLSG